MNRKTHRQDQIRRMQSMHTNHFSDRWEDDFDKTFKRAGKAIIGIWALSALVSLTLVGVAIWGIIRLVNHFA